MGRDKSGYTIRLPGTITEKQADRFWSYVDIREETECWPWTGSLNKYNYGQFGLDSTLRAVRAPRLAFRLWYGADPWPCDICHRCDNRPCCNPAHFFLGAHRVDNNSDRHSKGRTARGSTLHRSSITEKDIPVIRERCKNESDYAVSRDYGVRHSSIRDIRIGKTWKHVPF